MMKIAFPYRQEEAEQAVLWLLNRHNGKMDVMKLLKLLLFADLRHLARYGRPIVGGGYKAMQYGPVANDLYKTMDTDVPSDAPYPYAREGNAVKAKQMANEDFLSESDLEVLEEVDCEYGKKDTFALSDITHELGSWRRNYTASGRAAPISYEDFLSDLGEEGEAIYDLVREDCEARLSLG